MNDADRLSVRLSANVQVGKGSVAVRLHAEPFGHYKNELAKRAVGLNTAIVQNLHAAGKIHSQAAKGTGDIAVLQRGTIDILCSISKGKTAIEAVRAGGKGFDGLFIISVDVLAVMENPESGMLGLA